MLRLLAEARPVLFHLLALERCRGLARELAQMGGFLARVAPAKGADHRDQHKAELDEDLAAVEPVDWVTFQCGVGEETVKEKSRRGEINSEVERLPKMAAQPEPKIRSDNHEGDEIEGNGADGVFKRLAGRMDGINEIQEPKPWVLVEKQNGWMQ